MKKSHILSQSAFWIINKAVAKEISIDGALLLSELIFKQEQFADSLTRDGFFFYEKENIESETTITPYRQTLALNKLLELRLVESKKIGIPHKLYYKVDIDRVNKFISKLHT